MRSILKMDLPGIGWWRNLEYGERGIGQVTNTPLVTYDHLVNNDYLDISHQGEALGPCEVEKPRDYLMVK